MESPEQVIAMCRTKTDEFVNANILGVVAGTTGPKGGDAGYGGRTILQLHDAGSTSWEIWVDGVRVSDYPTTVAIVLGGDAEMETFANALLFAATQLRLEMHRQEE